MRYQPRGVGDCCIYVEVMPGAATGMANAAHNSSVAPLAAHPVALSSSTSRRTWQQQSHTAYGNGSIILQKTNDFEKKCDAIHNI